MNMRPLHDRVIVHRLDEGEQRIDGIIIPDTAKEKPQQGTIIAAGNGKAKATGKRSRRRQNSRSDPLWQVCSPGDQTILKNKKK